VLGPLAEASYERGFVIMKPGDLLVFYTDGIVETRGHAHEGAPREEYGTERLLAVVREAQGKPAQAVVEAIFTSVEVWSGAAPASDDRTVMVVHYPPAELGKTAAFPLPVGLI
jgi:sigma-B regulation protein RsbU (phosphoserine phosphatase)